MRLRKGKEQPERRIHSAPRASRKTVGLSRVGIYAGTFNPVHAGHIAFALQAIQEAKLDKVYFLPERRPRNKQSVEHFGHRVAMLKTAAKPHGKLGVLELDDISFTVKRTLHRLESRFKGKQLVFLMGSDVAEYISEWPLSEQLLAHSELVIGHRGNQSKKTIKSVAATWSQQPRSLYIIESYAPHVSSGTIREALRKRRYTSGLLRSVAQYSNRHWLYVSLA